MYIVEKKNYFDAYAIPDITSHKVKGTGGHLGSGGPWVSRDVLTMSISFMGTIDNTCKEMLTLHGGPEKIRDTIQLRNKS